MTKQAESIGLLEEKEIPPPPFDPQACNVSRPPSAKLSEAQTASRTSNRQGVPDAPHRCREPPQHAASSTRNPVAALSIAPKTKPLEPGYRAGETGIFGV